MSRLSTSIPVAILRAERIDASERSSLTKKWKLSTRLIAASSNDWFWPHCAGPANGRFWPPSASLPSSSFWPTVAARTAGAKGPKADLRLYAGKRGSLASSTAALNAVSHAAHCSGDAWPSTVMPDGSNDASKHGSPEGSQKKPIESDRAPGNPRSSLPSVATSASVRRPV